MKSILNVFFLISLIVAKCFGQSEYDKIPIDQIAFENIPLSDLNGILSRVGKKISKKIYTPPEGDTDEYERIHYNENRDIKIKFYEISGDYLLSSITLKSNKYQIKLMGEVFNVGLSELSLLVFQKSAAQLKKQRSSAQDDKKTEFHLDVVYPNGAQGTLTMRIKNGLITRISISLYPA